jgi:hypothetical protein
MSKALFNSTPLRMCKKDSKQCGGQWRRIMVVGYDLSHTYTWAKTTSSNTVAAR